MPILDALLCSPAPEFTCSPFLPLLSDQGCWSGAGLDTWLPSVWNGTSEAPAVLCPSGMLWPWDNLAGPPGAWDRLDLSFCSFSLLKGP